MGTARYVFVATIFLLTASNAYCDETGKGKQSDLQSILNDYSKRDGAQTTTESSTGIITSVTLNGVVMRKVNDTLMSAEDHSNAGPVVCHLRTAIRTKAIFEVCRPDRADIIDVYSQKINEINKFIAENIALSPDGYKESLDQSAETGVTNFKVKYANLSKEEVGKACSSAGFRNATSLADENINKVKDILDKYYTLVLAVPRPPVRDPCPM
jgi:hypothetical protein